jgi:hypothetical protein
MSFARDEEIRRLRIENRRLRYEIKLMKAKNDKNNLAQPTNEKEKALALCEDTYS